MLRFHSREEVTGALSTGGFHMVDVRDAPDRPGEEMVFVACWDGQLRPVDVTCRLAVTDEVEDLRRIEALAGELFRSAGMHDVADDPVAPAAHYLSYIGDGRAWVTLPLGGGPAVGYAFARPLGPNAHLEQVSVVPAAQRRGIGRGLVRAVCSWALDRGYPALTLTTFEALPWNRPWYEGLGFAVLRSSQMDSELRALLDEEQARWGTTGPRVAMGLLLG